MLAVGVSAVHRCGVGDRNLGTSGVVWLGPRECALTAAAQACSGDRTSWVSRVVQQSRHDETHRTKLFIFPA